MTTYDLTNNEMQAAKVLVQTCLDNMGGKRPADLEHDECTWIMPSDLIEAGWNKNEAAGTWSALDAKGFIQDNDPGCTDGAHWIVTTSGWKWMEDHWTFPPK